MKQDRYVLAVFIEPTPYIMEFLRELEMNWPGKIDVVFLKENHTQDWELILPPSYQVLSTSLIKIIFYLKSLLYKKKYSLIHVAGWSSLACLYLLFAAKIKTIPLSLESDTQFNYNISLWKRSVKYLLYPMLFKLPTIFLPGGSRQSKYLRHYGVPADKIFITQMTVDVGHLKRQVEKINDIERIAFRQKYGAQENEVVFLFVGRLMKCKRVRDLIQAFQSLQSLSAKLWIVGSGEEENYVKASVERIPGIHYFGRESKDRLTLLYNAADVFVLPSCTEQWGLVVNEAMATGNALIISEQVGCVDDLIFHKKTGLLFPAKNIFALGKSMEYLLLDSEYREKLANQAEEHISSWTLENEAKNVVRAWEHLLSNVQRLL